LARGLRIGSLSDGEGFGKFAYEFAGAQAVQVFDGAVVRQYANLISGEENREEVVVLFVARVIRVTVAQGGAGTAGAGGAVVAVGDVKQRHLLERFDELRRVFVGNAPDRVADPIGSGK